MLTVVMLMASLLWAGGCDSDSADNQNGTTKPPPSIEFNTDASDGSATDAGQDGWDGGWDTSLNDSGRPDPVDAGHVADAGEDSGENGEEDSGLLEPESEVRAVWVTRWAFSQPQHIWDVIERSKNAGFNVILFQVRGQADAYYHSQVEPWARRLTGTLGNDPGWDPLLEAITAAQHHGVELHAWINVFPAWTDGEGPITESTPRHVLLENPHWQQVDPNGVPAGEGGGYRALSPGIPEVRDHLVRVVRDLMESYPLDGLHLDYIRYTHRSYSHDTISNERYAQALQAEPELSRDDWQRQQITETVRDIRNAVLDVRPSARLSAATIGVYQDLWGWGSLMSGYRDTYQDYPVWVQEGLIDDIAPMIYHPMTDPPGGRLDFATLYDDHLATCRPYGVGVWAGIDADFDFAQIADQIANVRQVQGTGFALFSSASIDSNTHWQELGQGPFADPSPPPGPPR